MSSGIKTPDSKPAEGDNPKAAPQSNDVSVAEEFAGGCCCSECGAPGDSLETTWCRQCGFYAKFGTWVDLDSEWEDGVVPDEGGGSIPVWAYLLAGSFFGVAALSVIARLTLPQYPRVHMYVGMSQLVIGFTVFMSLHFMGFFKRSMRDGGAKLMDILSPFAIWGPVFHELPQSQRKLITGWTSLWAAIFAVAITGGQPTSWMEFKATVVKEKEKEKGPGGPGGPEGTGDLESAIEDFAEKGTRNITMPGDEVGGKAAAVGAAAGDGEEEEPEEEDKELLETECVVVGYLPAFKPQATETPEANQDGDSPGGPGTPGDSSGPEDSSESTSGSTATAELPAIRALVVASQVGGRLCVVGYVTEGITVSSADRLIEKFSEHLRDTPFVACRVSGIWVEPKFICKVKYKEWDTRVGLIEPQFEGIIQQLP